MNKFIFSILFIFIIKSSYAFEPKGHLEIEIAAINSLIKTLATEDHPDGLTMYQYLVEYEILLNDEKINSAFPDFDIGRQFLSDRQVYHFMANSKYVVEALKESTIEEQKQALTIKALPECLNMLYILMQEVVENPIGANQAGRGTYVLIHAITDSYSREHTIRNSSTNEIESIKSWELSKLFWQKEAKIIDSTFQDGSKTLLFLHTRKGTEDYKWWIEQDSTFSKNATLAVKSIKELLISLYMAANDVTNSDSIITRYLEANFKPSGSTLINNHFVFDSDSIKISYAEDYNEYGASTINFDRYPQFSQMISYKSNFQVHSFGYEFGYRITPRSASSSHSLLKRLPYGFLFSAHENTDKLESSNILKTIQFQIAVSTALYLPFGDISLEPKIGFGTTPFFDQNFYPAIILGMDISVNVGHDFTFINHTIRTTRVSIGYEYNSSNLLSKHNINLKLGFNTWQGRVIKRKAANKTNKQ